MTLLTDKSLHNIRAHKKSLHYRLKWKCKEWERNKKFKLKNIITIQCSFSYFYNDFMWYEYIIKVYIYSFQDFCSLQYFILLDFVWQGFFCCCRSNCCCAVDGDWGILSMKFYQLVSWFCGKGCRDIFWKWFWTVWFALWEILLIFYASLIFWSLFGKKFLRVSSIRGLDTKRFQILVLCIFLFLSEITNPIKLCLVYSPPPFSICLHKWLLRIIFKKIPLQVTNFSWKILFFLLSAYFFLSRSRKWKC